MWYSYRNSRAQSTAPYKNCFEIGQLPPRKPLGAGGSGKTSARVVRLFENERSRCNAKITRGFTLAAAYICNLLEENGRELPIDGSVVQLEITPYQIQTLRLVAN